jgi:hypothetical protein
LAAIAESQAKAGDAQGARLSFASALESARAISHEWARAEALVAIAESQAKAGDTQGALESARAISDKWGARAEALRAIAESQAKAGDAQGARLSFATALESARAISDERARARALAALAQSQARAGDFGGITDTLALLRVHRHDHLPSIAAALIEAAQTDAAAREQFHRLLLMCAPDVDAALAMCPHLARLFPASATAIANIVIHLGVD